jgi:hypothetical protein
MISKKKNIKAMPDTGYSCSNDWLEALVATYRACYDAFFEFPCAT